jgi:hypothetical protein
VKVLHPGQGQAQRQGERLGAGHDGRQPEHGQRGGPDQRRACHGQGQHRHGLADLDDIVGDVFANTVSGDIECHDLEGDFKGNSVSGALTVQASRLGQIKLNTVSGDITLDLTDGRAQIQSNSVSGDVTVRIPRGAAIDVAAHTPRDRSSSTASP